MRPRPATVAWAGLVAYVVAVDTLLMTQEARGNDRYCTMSSAFKEALRHPRKRIPLLLAWGILTVHLFPILYPKKFHRYDPVSLVGGSVSGFVGRGSGSRAPASSR